MVADNYYLVAIGGYLHDIGKIITNYLYEDENFRIYVEKSRGVGSHRHAKAGSLLLFNYDFPKPIISIVENHHGSEVDNVVRIIQWADRFDASYRAGTAKDKGKKLPIEIANIIGLDVTRTLHGVDLGDYLRGFSKYVGGIAKSNPGLAALLIDGFYREATIHLRSDSVGDENISLYAHSKIVAALTSLKARYPSSKPAFFTIEAAIEERAQFMTVDVIEYLAGLHIYVYFGILGAVSSALKDLELDPSFHIASESTTRFIVILGREHIKTLINYLKKPAADLDVSICVESYVMEKGVLRKDMDDEIVAEPTLTPVSSQLVCDICHQPIRDRKLMLVLRRASKTLRLCERCSIIMYAYEILSSNKGALCVKKARNGLLSYPQLNLAVTICDPFKDDYITARMLGFQNRSLKDVDVMALIPTIDVHLDVFRKEYKYLTGLSFRRLLNKLIKENKLHEYVSTINILNKYILHVVRHAEQQGSKIHPLEILDDRAVFGTISLLDANPAINIVLSSKLREYTAIAIVRRGSPGTTYKKLRYILQKIATTDKFIAIESLDNALSLNDVSAFNELARLLKVPHNMLHKRLVKLLHILEGYADSFGQEDNVEKVYLKSLILSRLFEPISKGEESKIVESLPFFGTDIYEEKIEAEEDLREKLSKFINEKSNIRSVINVVLFLNRVGKVVLHE